MKTLNRKLVLGISIYLSAASISGDEKWAGPKKYERAFSTLCNDRGMFSELIGAEPMVNCKKNTWFDLMFTELLDGPYTMDFTEDNMFRRRSNAVYQSTLSSAREFEKLGTHSNLRQTKKTGSEQLKKPTIPTLKSYKTISQ